MTIILRGSFCLASKSSGSFGELNGYILFVALYCKAKVDLQQLNQGVPKADREAI